MVEKVRDASLPVPREPDSVRSERSRLAGHLPLLLEVSSECSCAVLQVRVPASLSLLEGLSRAQRRERRMRQEAMW